MSNLQLLAAGFSAILGEKVVTPDKGTESISINQLVRCTESIYSTKSVYPDETFEVYARTLSGEVLTIQANNDFTVAELKEAVESKTAGDIPVSGQRIIFAGKQLEDGRTIEAYGIKEGYTLHVVARYRGGEGGPIRTYQLDPRLLDPEYDYDLTGVKHDGKTYMRGGFPYKRPYGWFRLALKVRGNYGDDDWLGPDGIRTESSSGEWPVSYHGTNFTSAKKIAEHGYKAGSEAAFGKGVYSSPSLDMVEKYYAESFSFEGKTYLIVFQNRVNPDVAGGRLVIIPAAENMSGADYWLSPKHDAEKNIHDVRPYGVLFKQIK